MNKPNYTWWVQHAHTDSAFLFLMEDAELFKQQILSHLDKIGRGEESQQAKQEVVNQAMYRAIWEQDRFGAMTSILEDIKPANKPHQNNVRPIAGELKPHNRSLADDRGNFPALGVSAFWCPWAVKNNMGVIDRLADWASGCGMTYVRWFGAHDWDVGIDPKSTPNYFSLMEKTIEALAERNLRSDITAFTRRHMVAGCENEFIDQWAELVNTHRDKVCLFEIANEWNHSHNGWSDNEVQELASRFASKSLQHEVPLALSAPAGETWDDMAHSLKELYTGIPASALTIHFPRKDTTHEGQWRWVRQPWHSRHGISGCPRFTVDNEHYRWDKDKTGRRIEVAAAAPLIAFISGCAMSAHHDVFGVHYEQGEYSNSPENELLQKVFAAVMPILPDDLSNWQPIRVGETNLWRHPFPSLIDEHWSFDATLNHGVSRAFAALNQDKFVMVLSGVKEYVNLADHQALPYRAISLRTGEEIYHGHGPVKLDEHNTQAYLVITA